MSRTLTALLTVALMGTGWGAPSLVSAEEAAAFGAIVGTSNAASLRLRNLDSTNVVDITVVTQGEFVFGAVSPASYIIEMVDHEGRLSGTSPLLAVEAGRTIAVSLMTSSAAADLLSGPGVGIDTRRLLLGSVVGVVAGASAFVLGDNGGAIAAPTSSTAGAITASPASSIPAPSASAPRPEVVSATSSAPPVIAETSVPPPTPQEDHSFGVPPPGGVPVSTYCQSNPADCSIDGHFIPWNQPTDDDGNPVDPEGNRIPLSPSSPQ